MKGNIKVGTLSQAFGNATKILLYAVVALEVIEFAQAKMEQIKNGDYKPVNAVSNEAE